MDKLYVSNHLGNTASYLAENKMYIHWLGEDINFLAYPKFKTSEDMLYEFDVKKMEKLGFDIERCDWSDNDPFDVVIPERFRLEKNLLNNINEFVSKVYINLEMYNLVYDIETEEEWFAKFGKPTVNVEFI